MSHVTFYDIITLIGIVFGVALSVGAAYFLFKTGLERQAAATWKDNSDAQEKRADIADAKLETALAEIDRLQHRIEAVEADNAALREMVTSRAEVAKLAAIVAKNHSAQMNALLHLTQELGKLTVEQK